MNSILFSAMVDEVQTLWQTSEDPASFELVMRPWELLCRPGSRGNFEHRLRMFKTPLFQIYQESFSLAAQVQGLSPAGALVLAIPLGKGKMAKYWHDSHGDSTLPATLPGPLDVTLKEGHSHMVLIVDLEQCRHFLDEHCVEVLLEGVVTHKLPVRGHTLSGLVAWGRRILHFAHPDQVPALESAVVSAINLELAGYLSLIASELEPGQGKGTYSSRQLGLCRALDYLRTRRNARLSIPELLAAADISERSLQYGFKDAFGMTPQAFIKCRRLHFARQQLLTQCSDEASVSQVAAGLGFYELGRFAKEYRQLFGQLPSETLRRHQVFSIHGHRA